MTEAKRRMDMRAGYLYIMQYPYATYIKTGRAVNARNRLKQNVKGTKLLLEVVTSDMRAAEAAMLASLRSAEAAAEGIEALRDEGLGNETFSGPFLTIARRVTEAAWLFPAAPHNLLSEEAAREWYRRECDAGNVGEGVGIRQFLIDNECLTDLPRERAPHRERDADGASDEQQIAHQHGMAVERYAVDEGMCDVRFFDMFVGTLADRARMVRQFYALQRFHRAAHLTVAELRDEHSKLQGDAPPGSSLAALHKSRQHQFYNPAMEVGRLLDHLAGAAWRDNVVAREALEVRLSAFVPAVLAWAREMTSEEYASLNAMLGIRPSKGEPAERRDRLIAALEKASSKGVSNPALTATSYAKVVLKRAFGVALLPHRGDPKSRRKPLDYSAYAELVDTYKVACMRPAAAGAALPVFVYLPNDEIGYKDDGANETRGVIESQPLLTSSGYAALEARREAKQGLSQLEMQQVWEYDMAINLYGLRRTEVDAMFLAEYVGADGSESMREQLRRLSRFGYAHTHTAAQLRLCQESADYVAEAFGDAHAFWLPAVAVGELLDRVAPDWRGKVSDALGRAGGGGGGAAIRFSSKAAALALLRWASGMDDERYAQLLKMLGIKPRPEQPSRKRMRLIESLRELDEEGEEAASSEAACASSPDGGGCTSTPRGKVKTSSALVNALIEAAFGVKCIVGDGVISLDVDAFTYMCKRRERPYGTHTATE